MGRMTRHAIHETYAPDFAKPRGFAFNASRDRFYLPQGLEAHAEWLVGFPFDHSHDWFLRLGSGDGWG